MKIERPNAAPLTKADLSHLETLRSIVENVVADGLITNDERAYIDQVIWADGEATPKNSIWCKT